MVGVRGLQLKAAALAARVRSRIGAPVAVRPLPLHRQLILNANATGLGGRGKRIVEKMVIIGTSTYLSNKLARMIAKDPIIV